MIDKIDFKKWYEDKGLVYKVIDKPRSTDILVRGEIHPLHEFVCQLDKAYYPKDKYFPSYLVYSHYQDKIFHVLFAVDIEEDNVRVITAYYPDLEEWKEDFKTRR